MSAVKKTAALPTCCACHAHVAASQEQLRHLRCRQDWQTGHFKSRDGATPVASSCAVVRAPTAQPSQPHTNSGQGLQGTPPTCHQLKHAQQHEGVVGCGGEQAQQLLRGAAAAARPVGVHCLRVAGGGCQARCSGVVGMGGTGGTGGGKSEALLGGLGGAKPCEQSHGQ